MIPGMVLLHFATVCSLSLPKSVNQCIRKDNNPCEWIHIWSIVHLRWVNADIRPDAENVLLLLIPEETMINVRFKWDLFCKIHFTAQVSDMYFASQCAILIGSCLWYFEFGLFKYRIHRSNHWYQYDIKDISLLRSCRTFINKKQIDLASTMQNVGFQSCTSATEYKVLQSFALVINKLVRQIKWQEFI